jgi:ATP-dependent Clp protease adaptor protein ClpS
VSTQTPVKPGQGLSEDDAASRERDRPWLVIVWDDPVNLMSYVTLVFQRVLGHSKTKARRLMMEVHTAGKAVVASGSLEKSEHDVYQLQEHGLWATLQRDGSE